MTPGGHEGIPAVETLYQFGVIPGLIIFGGVAAYVKIRNLLDRRRYGQYELEASESVLILEQVWDEADAALASDGHPKPVAAR